jgi:hypothetical protein
MMLIVFFLKMFTGDDEGDSFGAIPDPPIFPPSAWVSFFSNIYPIASANKLAFFQIFWKSSSSSFWFSNPSSSF